MASENERNEILDLPTEPTSPKNEDMYSTGGKGLCIVMANFVGHAKNTMHLPGYINDIKCIKKLFIDMDFDVISELEGITFKNLTKDKFKQALAALQKHLDSDQKQESGDRERRNQYDKVIIVILSHGNELGILMCKDETGEKEDKFLSVESIVDHFTHDNIPSLSGIPKCFFIQACRGSSTTQIASKKGDHGETGGKKLRGQQPSITRANIFIAYSTLEKSLSFVDEDRGSWFIQELVSAIEKFHRKEDVMSIMTRVIRKVSEKTGKYFFPCNEYNHEVRVRREGKDGHFPVIVYGRLKDSVNSNESDEKFKKGFRILHVTGEKYDGFKHDGTLAPILGNYDFKGKVFYKLQPSVTPMNFGEWTCATALGPLNQENFEIEGELRCKGQPDAKPIAEKGTIIVHMNNFEMKHHLRPTTPELVLSDTTLDFKFEVDGVHVSFDDLNNKTAWYYIDGKAHSSGKFQGKKDGVFGIYADIYQLPVISSTLVKKFYLTPPCLEKAEAETFDEIGRQVVKIVDEANILKKPEQDESSRMDVYGIPRIQDVEDVSEVEIASKQMKPKK